VYAGLYSRPSRRNIITARNENNMQDDVFLYTCMYKARASAGARWSDTFAIIDDDVRHDSVDELTVLIDVQHRDGARS